MNKAILIGNLGKDPEVKTLDGGNKLAKFVLATSYTYKDKAGEKVSETTWHNILVWGKMADVVEKYMKKGDKVSVVGRIVNRSYTDKEGVKKYTTEINCDEFEMLSGKKKEEGAANTNTNTNTASSKSENDDLPF